jgi:hypothetical protein
MKTYVIEINNKILGVYNDYQQLEAFLKSSIQNNFISSDNIYISVFNINSCFLLEKQKYLYNTDNTYNLTDPSKISETINISEPYNTYNIPDPSKPTEPTKSTEPTKPTEPSEPIKSVDTINESQQLEEEKYKVELLAEQIEKQKNKAESLAEQKKEIQHKINLLRKQKEILKNLQNEYNYDIKLYDFFKKKTNEDNEFVIPELFKNKYEIMKTLESENKLSWDNYYNTYSKMKGENNYDLFNENPYNNKF